jgi:hypothetical protein
MSAAALTAEQEAAVAGFAKLHGRQWKAALTERWLSGWGRDSSSYVPHLQRIRNTLGPRWLDRYKLPPQP